VWQSDYDALQAKNQQLQQQVTTQRQRSPPTRRRSADCRVRSSIRRPVVPAGRLSDEQFGQADHCQDGDKIGAGQQNKLVVSGYTDHAPIGPELRRQGIASNQREEPTCRAVAGGRGELIVRAPGPASRRPTASSSVGATNRAPMRSLMLAALMGTAVPAAAQPAESIIATGSILSGCRALVENAPTGDMMQIGAWRARSVPRRISVARCGGPVLLLATASSTPRAW
jgi:hypothetical protein